MILMRTSTKAILMMIVLLATTLAAMAADPPERVNYQGVLRDASGNPENGSFDMTFMFFDAAVGGNQLLVDEHLAVGTGAVIVTDGLFNAELGGGNLFPGSGSGAVSTIGDLFGGFTDLFLEIQVQSEVLTPRVPILSSGFALNSRTLAGRDAAQFLDTSGSPQTKSGDLALGGDLFVTSDVQGNQLNLSAGGQDFGHLSIASIGGSPGPLLTAEPWGDAYILIQPDDHMEFWSADSQYIFWGPGYEELILHGGGADINGTLTVGQVSTSGVDLTSGGDMGTISKSPVSLVISTGSDDTDYLQMNAGNSIDDGRILINGAGSMLFESGSNQFQFFNDSISEMTLTNTNPANNEWTFGGTFLDLRLTDSSNDFVFVQGSFAVGGPKNFIQNHPESPDLSVVYTALEGDEAGTYTRGSARLEAGVARISLGRSFRWVTNPDVGLTAHVTPRGEWAELYVDSVSTEELVVRSREGSADDVAFDYVVHGLRLGWEQFSVVQDRRVDATVPDPESFNSEYEKSADRRSLSALSRFRRMHADVWGLEPVESHETVALRVGAGMHRLERPLIAPLEPAGPRKGAEMEDQDTVGATDRMPKRPASVPAPASDTPEFSDYSASGPSRISSRPAPPPDLTAVLPVIGAVEPGDLLVIDPDGDGSLQRSHLIGDSAIVGIVTEGPMGPSTRVAMNEDGLWNSSEHERSGRLALARVAMAGLVMMKVDAGYGAIRPGDLLMSSPTPGHAMRADDPAPGTIVGKALQGQAHGTGLIRVAVMLR